MGAMATTKDIPAGDDIMARLDELSGKLETERRMREITNTIHSLPLDELILSVREDVQRLVLCDRVTIFAKDPRREEIYSKHMDGGEVKEIRVPINMGSLAGFVALKKQTLRLADVYDLKAVAAVDPKLKFDPTWDKKTGCRILGKIYHGIHGGFVVRGYSTNSVSEQYLAAGDDGCRRSYRERKSAGS